MLPVIATLLSFHPFLAILCSFPVGYSITRTDQDGPQEQLTAKFRPGDVKIDIIFSFFCTKFWAQTVIPLSVYSRSFIKYVFQYAKNAISQPFNGRGKTRFDFIVTRQRDRKLVRDVTVHTQPPFLPISDHNIVTAHVKLLGRFPRNRPVREAKGPPPIDRRRLTTNPHLRQEAATVIGDHLRAFPPSGSSVDDVETAFTTAILQTSERVARAAASAQTAGAEIEGRHPGRSRDQHGDGRETSSLEAAKG